MFLPVSLPPSLPFHPCLTLFRAATMSTLSHATPHPHHPTHLESQISLDRVEELATRKNAITFFEVDLLDKAATEEVISKQATFDACSTCRAMMLHTPTHTHQPLFPAPSTLSSPLHDASAPHAPEVLGPSRVHSLARSAPSLARSARSLNPPPHCSLAPYRSLAPSLAPPCSTLVRRATPSSPPLPTPLPTRSARRATPS